MSDATAPEMAGPYPAELECDVLLSDGRTARLRAIRPDDAPALRELGEKLSKETVYFRFFSPRRSLSDKEITHFVTVDYQDRLALVAIVDGDLVAVARYDCVPGASRGSLGAPGGSRSDRVAEAEVAFVVRDDQQGRGLGTVMLEHLASAAVARGIGRFVADTLVENHRMIGVFRSAGFEESASLESGVVRVEMELVARPEYLERVEEREWRATVRSIERILRPASIAVLEATSKPGDVGHDLVSNLLAAGYRGSVHPVSRTDDTVCGVASARTVGDVPGPIDLALITVPATELAQAIRECGEKGVCGLVVMTAGHLGQGASAAAFERDLVDLARSSGMRLVGPNSVGVINTSPEVLMNATVAPDPTFAGRVAISSQSGGLGLVLLGDLASRGLGISSFVSVGDKADVSGNDLLRLWAGDGETDVILLYLESFGNPRKFNRIARRVARKTPIVAVKSARTTSGLRGARQQDGSPLVPDHATDALFRQAGVIRVDTLEELLDVAEVLVSQPLPRGGSVAIVGNAGGCGVLAADACESQGLQVLELAPETQRRLLAVASPGSTVGNPVGLTGSANAQQYGSVLEILLADEAVDSVVVTYTELSPHGSDEVAEAVASVAGRSAKPLVANFVGTNATLRALREGVRRVPWFAYPESAARALARIVPYAKWRAGPEGTAAVFEDVDVSRARSIVADALAGGAVWLNAAAALDLLAAYGISAVPAPGTEKPAVPDGVETVVGLLEDESFGPLVTFGLGGDEAELLGDRAWSLVPLAREEAEELITGSRSSSLLTGYKGAAPVDVGGLVDLVLRVARLAEDLPEVVELSLSPVIASPDDVAVLDFRVRVAEVSHDPALLRRAMRMA